MEPQVQETTEVSVSSPVESQAPAPEVPAAEGEKAQGEVTKGAVEAGAKEGDPSPGKEEGEPKKEPEPYKPRDKFKVMEQEHEVPAWMKAALKDAETEKQAIEILEKAFGLDHVKPRLAETRKERDHFRTELQRRDAAISDARGAYQRGDIDLFLDKLSIPHERMLQWALDKVNYSQLPPEQQRVLDEKRDAQRRAYSLEEQNKSYADQVFEQAREAKATLLQAGLARPDVSAFANAYDAQAGKPGAFRELVINEGELAWIQSEGKVDLSPDQAIERALAKWKNFVGFQSPTPPVVTPTPAAAAQAPAQGAGNGQGVVTQPQAKAAVIPNVQGRTSSPVKSSPRSLEDLKKLQKQFSAG